MRSTIHRDKKTTTFSFSTFNQYSILFRPVTRLFSAGKKESTQFQQCRANQPKLYSAVSLWGYEKTVRIQFNHRFANWLHIA